MNARTAHDLRNAEIREERLLDILSQHGLSPDAPSTAEVKARVRDAVVDACQNARNYRSLTRCEDMTPEDYIATFHDAAVHALGGDPASVIQNLGEGLLPYDDTADLIALFNDEAQMSLDDAVESINERRYRLGYDPID